MRVEKTLTITAQGDVSVKATPNRGYAGTTSIYIEVSWAPSPTGLYGVSVQFGDGQSTGGQVPTSPFTCSHTYATVGTFTITATVNRLSPPGPPGSGTATVDIRGPMRVDFTVDKNTGPAPLTVLFGVAVSYAFEPFTWVLDYGNGSPQETGTLPTPSSFTRSHTYANAGTFTAKVTVTDALGATVVRSEQISLGQTGLVVAAAFTVAGLLGLYFSLR